MSNTNHDSQKEPLKYISRDKQLEEPTKQIQRKRELISSTNCFFFFSLWKSTKKAFYGDPFSLSRKKKCIYPLMVWKLGSEWNGLFTSRIYSTLWVILHSLIKEKRRRRIKTKKGSHSVWNDRSNRVLLPLVYLQTQQYGSVSSFCCAICERKY